MSACGRSIAVAKRRAFTLMELLLTLCLLVVLASITWPAIGRPMARQRLREAADQVRAEWVKARVKAMSTGMLHVFRYAIDGDHYVIEVQEDEESTDAASIDAAENTDVANERTQQRHLPEKVKFSATQAAGATATDATAASTDNPAIAQGVPTSSSNDSSLSAPIIFRPDGTCSTVRVRLENEYQQVVELAMRGLTGVVTVGEVQAGSAAP